MKCVSQCEGGFGRILGRWAGESYAAEKGGQRTPANAICIHP
jgi:hypothetical protein